MTFGEESSSASAAAASKAEAVPLPAGLALTLALTAPIDTATAAAGDAVSARVTKAVRAPKSSEILIAAGAIVHGRILNMERFYNPAQHEYSLLFETVEQKGSVTPVSLELRRDPATMHVSTAAGPGGWFIVPGSRATYIVPAGSESMWVSK